MSTRDDSRNRWYLVIEAEKIRERFENDETEFDLKDVKTLLDVVEHYSTMLYCSHPETESILEIKICNSCGHHWSDRDYHG